jgi:DNA-directed RNA polymerase specialized sigma24 family protein
MPNAVTGSNTDVDDPERLERLRHDDEHALATIFRRYQRPVYGGGFSVLRSRAEAEEIAADVFLTLWRKRHSIEIAATSMLPWLIATARNLALNRNRLVSRRREQPITEPGNRLPASGPSPLRKVSDRRTHAVTARSQAAPHSCSWPAPESLQSRSRARRPRTAPHTASRTPTSPVRRLRSRSPMRSRKAADRPCPCPQTRIELRTRSTCAAPCGGSDSSLPTACPSTTGASTTSHR